MGMNCACIQKEDELEVITAPKQSIDIQIFEKAPKPETKYAINYETQFEEFIKSPPIPSESINVLLVK